MSKTALIIVDAQNDFLPGGALGAPEGDKVIAPLVELAHDVDYVIATRDWHPENHISFKERGGPWPIHCVQNTPGAELHDDIAEVADLVMNKGTDSEKEEYSIFESPAGQHLSDWLREYDVEHVWVGGLVDEYCVKETAIGAAEYGFDTTLRADASAALSEEGKLQALLDAAAHGVNIVEGDIRG